MIHFVRSGSERLFVRFFGRRRAARSILTVFHANRAICVIRLDFGAQRLTLPPQNERSDTREIRTRGCARASTLL